MIVVKIEHWPSGREEEKEIVGEAKIFNREEEVYDARLWSPALGTRLIRLVEPSKINPWQLIHKILNDTFKSE